MILELTDELDFSEALGYMKRGYPIRRHSWKQGEYIYCDSEATVTRLIIQEDGSRGVDLGDKYTCYHVTPDGSESKAYVFSASDILAEDWQLNPEI